MSILIDLDGSVADVATDGALFLDVTRGNTGSVHSLDHFIIVIAGSAQLGLANDVAAQSALLVLSPASLVTGGSLAVLSLVVVSILIDLDGSLADVATDGALFLDEAGSNTGCFLTVDLNIIMLVGNAQLGLANDVVADGALLVSSPASLVTGGSLAVLVFVLVAQSSVQSVTANGAGLSILAVSLSTGGMVAQLAVGLAALGADSQILAVSLAALVLALGFHDGELKGLGELSTLDGSSQGSSATILGVNHALCVHSAGSSPNQLNAVQVAVLDICGQSQVRGNGLSTLVLTQQHVSSQVIQSCSSGGVSIGIVSVERAGEVVSSGVAIRISLGPGTNKYALIHTCGGIRCNTGIFSGADKLAVGIQIGGIGSVCLRHGLPAQVYCLCGFAVDDNTQVIRLGAVCVTGCSCDGCIQMVVCIILHQKHLVRAVCISSMQLVSKADGNTGGVPSGLGSKVYHRSLVKALVSRHSSDVQGQVNDMACTAGDHILVFITILCSITGVDGCAAFANHNILTQKDPAGPFIGTGHLYVVLGAVVIYLDTKCIKVKHDKVARGGILISIQRNAVNRKGFRLLFRIHEVDSVVVPEGSHVAYPAGPSVPMFSLLCDKYIVTFLQCSRSGEFHCMGMSMTQSREQAKYHHQREEERA